MAGKQKVSDAELNRSLILLFIAFLLLIFMDVQAKRQAEVKTQSLDSLAPLSPILAPGRELGKNIEIDPLPDVLPDNLGGELQKISRKQLQKTGNSLERTVKRTVERYQDVGKNPQNPQNAQNAAAAAAAKEEAQAAAAYPKISWQKVLHSLQSVIPAPAKSSAPAIATVANPNGVFELYFIQYVKKKNVLIATKRWHKKNPLRLTEVLRQLKQGATQKERALLNNFTPDIPIHSVEIAGDAVILNLGQGMARYGSHVIQDRLDQVIYTLTQFPEIRSVRILIEGKRHPFLGDIPIESYLVRRNREVYRFSG